MSLAATSRYTGQENPNGVKKSWRNKNWSLLYRRRFWSLEVFHSRNFRNNFGQKQVIYGHFYELQFSGHLKK